MVALALSVAGSPCAEEDARVYTNKDLERAGEVPNAYRNEDQGFFITETFTLSNVTIRYNDIDYLNPKSFTVTTPAGVPVTG